MLKTGTVLRSFVPLLVLCVSPPYSSWAFQLVRPSTCGESSDVVCSRDPLVVTNYQLEHASDDNPIRWYEADQGRAIPFYVSTGGDADLGEEATITLVQQAMDAWNNVPGSSLKLVYAGTADPAPLNACSNPKNIIVFNDPYAEVTNHPAVTGFPVAGLTRACSDVIPPGVRINGMTFMPIRRAGIVIGKHLVRGTRPAINTDTLATTVTHELGHAIGLYHSSDDPNESDPNLVSAMMYYATDSELAASITPDDINGLLELYGHGETVPYWTCESEPFVIEIHAYVVDSRRMIEPLLDGLLKNHDGSLYYQCTRKVRLVLPTPHPGLRYLTKRVTEYVIHPNGNGIIGVVRFKVTKKQVDLFQVAIVLTFRDGTTRTLPSDTIDPAIFR
jgi:Matrixin